MLLVLVSDMFSPDLNIITDKYKDVKTVLILIYS